MVGKVHDPAFHTARQRNRLAVRGEVARGDGIASGDDGGGFKPADDQLFSFLRGGVFVGAGLRDDERRGEIALHRFGNREDVVFARGGKRLFLAAFARFEPLEDPGLVQVVQDFAAHGVVVGELEPVDVDVALVEIFGRENVQGRVRHKTARIGVVRGEARTRGRPEGLGRGRGATAFGEDFLALRVKKSLFDEDGADRVFVAFENRGGGIFENLEHGGAQSGALQLLGALEDHLPGRLHDVASLGDFDRTHREDVRDRTGGLGRRGGVRDRRGTEKREGAECGGCREEIAAIDGIHSEFSCRLSWWMDGRIVPKPCDSSISRG